MMDTSENAAAFPRRRLPTFGAEKYTFGGWCFGVPRLIDRISVFLYHLDWVVYR